MTEDYLNWVYDARGNRIGRYETECYDVCYGDEYNTYYYRDNTGRKWEEKVQHRGYMYEP